MPRAPKKILPINIRVDPDLKNDLKVFAESEQRPLANFIVRVLTEYRDERKARESAQK